jgi:hypothetical protein
MQRGDLVRYIAGGYLQDRLFLVLYSFPSGISCFCVDEDLTRKRYLLLPYELQVVSWVVSWEKRRAA